MDQPDQIFIFNGKYKHPGSQTEVHLLHSRISGCGDLCHNTQSTMMLKDLQEKKNTKIKPKIQFLNFQLTT